MSATHDEHIQKHVKTYLKVFAALAVGTVLTVWVAKVHMGIALAIGVAVAIAAFKGSLVAGYFMHLFSEKKLVYGILALTALFFAAMIALMVFTHRDQQGRHHGPFTVPAGPPQGHQEGLHVP